MRVLMWRGGHDLRVEEQPTPRPGPSEVLVRVAACGVCGTDIHTIQGGFPPMRPPRVLGHESAGVVEAMGAEVRGVSVGQAVAVEPSVPCGRCPACRDGAVGRPELAGACLGLLRRGGTAVVVGVNPPGATLAVDLYDLHVRELAIKTAWGRSYSFRRAVAWLPHLTLAPLITHRFPLEAGLEALTPRPGRIKVVIDPWS